MSEKDVKNEMMWCSKEIQGLTHYVYVSGENAMILCMKGWTIRVDPPDKVARIEE